MEPYDKGDSMQLHAWNHTTHAFHTVLYEYHISIRFHACKRHETIIQNQIVPYMELHGSFVNLDPGTIQVMIKIKSTNPAKTY